LEERYCAWSEQGIRVMAVATRTIEKASPFGRDLEHDLTFAGFRWCRVGRRVYTVQRLLLFGPSPEKPILR